MKKKVIITMIVGVLVLGLGVSIAYFTPIITGNGKEISLVAKELKVIYTDTSQINDGLIVPGWHISKTFTVENRSEDVYKYNIVIENLLNTFETEGFLQYKITNGGSGYSCDWTNVPKTTEPTNTVLAYNVEIADKAKQSYTIEFQYLETDEDQSADMGKSFNGSIMIEVGTEEPPKIPPFIAKLKEDNKTINTRASGTFNVAFGIAGLYKETDAKYLEPDGKTQNEVLYFAGNPDNNWVKFGKEGNDDIWWRIIRTNEDGSVRLLYAGKGASGHSSTTGYINASQQYNSSYDNTMYVGYMYGTDGSLENNRKDQENSSPIKITIDTWYTNNMKNTDTNGKTFSSYISRTAIYCSDRSTKKYAAPGIMYYGAAMRLTLDAMGTTYGGVTQKTEYHPTFKCGGNAKGDGIGLWDNGGDVADKFTGIQKSTTKVGNQLLGDAPIALMTADEVAYAGGINTSNSENTYYYKNSVGGSVTGDKYWWTMSPYNADADGWTYVFYVGGSVRPGYLTGELVVASFSVRPVVSLKSCVEVTGSGKVDDPYIPSIDGACAEADN